MSSGESPVDKQDNVRPNNLNLSTPKSPTVASRRQKVAKIRLALINKPVDISALKQLAISKDGLVSDELRKRAWPKLLDVDVDNIPPKPEPEILQGHRDYNQVVLDVNRSLKRFPPGMEENLRMSLQDQLVDVIMRVLVHRPELHYYQGYHDICVTFLLVVGEDMAFALVDKLSQNHLRDFMDDNMDRTKHMLNYLYPIIGKSSPDLREFMEIAEAGNIFCLSWLITWYGHVLNDIRQIIRFYDFFIACHQLMPIYLAAAIVLYRKKAVLATECEMCFVHSLLSKIPDDLPFEKLVSQAGDLFIQFPPKTLADEAMMIFEKSKAAAKMQRRAIAKRVTKGRFSTILPNGGSVIVSVTVWTLVAAVTAGVYAVWKSNDWGWFS
ncbi:hypothetical protein ScPMuIL_001129 [Solemya velum]